MIDKPMTEQVANLKAAFVEADIPWPSFPLSHKDTHLAELLQQCLDAFEVDGGDLEHAAGVLNYLRDRIKWRMRGAAPSEAVGRGEVVTGLMLAAQMTLKRADSELQCAIDFEADGYALGAEKCRATAEELDRLRLDLLDAASGQKSDIVNPRWNPAFMRAMTAKSVARPSADRDAIREALKPFAEAAKNAEISGRPPSEFVDAVAYELARSILERKPQ